MRKTAHMILLSFIILAPVLSVHAQSAEDLIKGESQGIVYSNSWVENGVRYLNKIIVRGDEITWLQTIGDVTRIAGFGPHKVVSTRREGKKLMLETDDKQVYIISGDIMEKGMMVGGVLKKSSAIFTRER